MVKYAAVFTVLFIVIVGGFFVFKRKSVDSYPRAVPTFIPSEALSVVDFKADFDIYTNGTRRIFTDAKYHNQSDDVYIEAGEPNIIRVKKDGLVWSDFFETLPMSLKKNCLITGTGQTFCTGDGGVLRFYINGAEDPDALDRKIQNGDKLLVEFTK